MRRLGVLVQVVGRSGSSARSRKNSYRGGGLGMRRSTAVGAGMFGLVLGLVLVAVSAFPSAALSKNCPAGFEFGPTVRALGGCETVFDYDWNDAKVNNCFSDSPDGNPRAFRDARNRIQLTLPGPKNMRMLGHNLND